MAARLSFDPSLPGDIRLMLATADALWKLGLAAFAAAALAWGVRLPQFALDDIRIEGEVARNSVSTIRANAVPRLAGTFFTLDLGAAQRAFEAVPWVRRAAVRRVWPNRLVVRLEEHRPVALWAGEDGDDRLVNSFGEVFEANLGDVEDDRLPMFAGPDGSAARLLAFFGRIAPVLAPLDAGVEALSLSGRGSWKLRLDTGAEIELGRGSDDEVVARTERFVATLEQVTDRYRRPLEFADLRHRDGYAVRLRGVTTTLPAPPAKPVRR